MRNKDVTEIMCLAQKAKNTKTKKKSEKFILDIKTR